MEGNPNKSYKIKEVAEILGCKEDNVYRLIKYGQLNAFKVGIGKRYLRVTAADINDFVERQRVRDEAIRNG